MGATVCLLAIFLIAAVIIYIRRRRRGQSLLPKKTEPKIPPHELAYAELKQLSESRLLEKGKVKLFYSKISEIIRRYTEERFQIDAMELTTTDLLIRLEDVLLADMVIIYQ